MSELGRRDALRLTFAGAPLVVFGCSPDPDPPAASADELPTETVEEIAALMHARASDEHHVKISHAVLLEAERLPDRFVPCMLACARLFAPSLGDPYGQVWDLLHGG